MSMSKTSIIHHQISVGKVNTKNKPGTRNSYSKLTLDLNTLDRKSQNTNPQDKNVYPPNSPVEKLGMMHQSQTKSPRSKHNSSGYPIDVFEVKDSFRYDTKIQPQTTKGSATASYVDIKFDKTKKGMNSTEKLVPSKLKEYQMKNLFPGFQIPNKKSGPETHKVGLSINLKDSRSKIIMEEPPKKFSVPNAYIMPHSVVGSGSHRGPLVTSKGDLSDVNSGPFTYMPFKRKGSQKLETEYDPQMHASITNKYGGFGGPTGNVSNVLNDLTSLPLELTKSNSKTTVNNTTNNIITNIMIGDKVPSPKGSNNFSGQYQDLLRLINEKDKEIQKLNSEKTELKSTLNTLASGVEDFKSMKTVLKEKERIITSLKNSLSVAIKESDVLRGETSAPEIQSGGHSHKRNKNSSFDIEGIKSLMYEIKSLEQDDEVETSQYETGNSQPDKVIKKTLSLKTKKSEPSYPGGTAAANYRFATNNSVIEGDIFNGGGSQESPLLRKNKDSPYYELIKGGANKKDLKISLDNKKEPKSGDKVVSGSDVQTTRVRTANTIVIKKRDPMGTPRKLQVNTDNLEGSAKTNYPNTTTGADMDMFKRKFSHDPRVVTDGFREFGGKKNSAIDLGSPATHHSNSGKAQEQPGSLDIGKALGELKNKIARLLDRHQHEHKNLRNIQDGYLKKLNEMLLNKEQQ